jgi:hypothetical protein
MAALDYGSIVKVNGKMVQTKMFMDMKKSVGYTVSKSVYGGNEIEIKGNFFSYLGDKEFTVCVYKTCLVFLLKGKVVKVIHGTDNNYDLPYEKFTHKDNINGIKIMIKGNKTGEYRYKLRFWYKNNLYECIYGYGVDLNLKYWYNLHNNEKNYLSKYWFNN